jgi:hypothetical protein
LLALYDPSFVTIAFPTRARRAYSELVPPAGAPWSWKPTERKQVDHVHVTRSGNDLCITFLEHDVPTEGVPNQRDGEKELLARPIGGRLAIVRERLLASREASWDPRFPLLGKGGELDTGPVRARLEVIAPDKEWLPPRLLLVATDAKGHRREAELGLFDGLTDASIEASPGSHRIARATMRGPCADDEVEVVRAPDGLRAFHRWRQDANQPPSFIEEWSLQLPHGVELADPEVDAEAPRTLPPGCDGTFDPRSIWLAGQTMAGNAVRSPIGSASSCGAFESRGVPVLGPDGRLAYVEAAGGKLRRFVPDVKTWDGARWIITSPERNDPVIPTKCDKPDDGVEQVWFHPKNGELYYRCNLSPIVKSATGAVFHDGRGELLAIGVDGSKLVVTDALSIVTPSATKKDVSGIVSRTARAAPDGFLVATGTRAKSCRLIRLGFDGTSSDRGTFSGVPGGTRTDSEGCFGVLDADGRLYQWATITGDASVQHVLVRRRLEPEPSEIVYTTKMDPGHAEDTPPRYDIVGQPHVLTGP